MINRVKAVNHHSLPSADEAMEALVGLNMHAGHVSSVRVDKVLVLYGAGELGKLARQHLALVGVSVECVVDRNAHAHKKDPEWAGYRLLTPEEVDPALKEHAILAVSIVTTRFAPLQASLVSMGWKHCVPFYDVAEFYRDLHPLSNGWYAGALSSDDMAACQKILEGLADDVSRAHYLRFAAWRLGREDWDYRGAPVTLQDRYFIPEVDSVLGPRERVFDVGAHHGSYLANFLRAKGELSSAWAVEPDLCNNRILKDWVETLTDSGRDRIKCYDCAIGSLSGTALFHSGLGYASQLAQTGQNLVDVKTIDSFGADPTIIKLHVEGGELEALKGAQDTLGRHRPVVMATIYHNRDGLVDTPLWLMRQLDDYDVVIRQHGWCGTGVVVYGIPKSRYI